jgi:hypothetical protein
MWLCAMGSGSPDRTGPAAFFPFAGPVPLA